MHHNMKAVYNTLLCNSVCKIQVFSKKDILDEVVHDVASTRFKFYLNLESLEMHIQYSFNRLRLGLSELLKCPPLLH